MRIYHFIFGCIVILVLSGCATTGKALFGIPVDKRMEAYNQYAATVDESVASGKISKLDGETLKYNALQQVQRDKADEQAQQAAAFGALYGGMAQMQQANAAEAYANRPYVSGGSNNRVTTTCRDNGFGTLYCS